MSRWASHDTWSELTAPERVDLLVSVVLILLLTFESA